MVPKNGNGKGRGGWEVWPQSSGSRSAKSSRPSTSRRSPSGNSFLRSQSSSGRSGSSSARRPASGTPQSAKGGAAAGQRPAVSRKPPAQSNKSQATTRSAKGGSGSARVARPGVVLTRGRLIAVVLLILAALGLGIYFLSASATKSLEQRQQSLQAVQEQDAVKPIAECRAADLDFKITNYDRSIPVGGPWNAAVTVTNRGADACLADGSAKSLGVRVTSGSYELVDTLKCASPDALLPLLIGPNRSWNTTLSWDGHDYESCEAGEAGASGTYVLHVSYLGDAKADLLVQVVEPQE